MGARGFGFATRLYAWGSNSCGQLGIPRSACAELRVPTSVPNALFPQGIRRFSCGGAHAVLITTDNQVFGWGLNDDFQLGIEDRNTSERQKWSVDPLFSRTKKSWVSSTSHHLGDDDDWIVDVACGHFSTLFLTQQGNVWHAGRDFMGNKIRKPVLVFDAACHRQHGGDGAVQVSVAADHGAILTKSGKLYLYGSNQQGKTGLGKTSGMTKEPTALDDILEDANLHEHRQPREPGQPGEPVLFSRVSCGMCHTVAIDKKGRMWSWGDNSYHQLGKIAKDRLQTGLALRPVRLELSDNMAMKDVSAGGSSTMALSQRGSLMGWGMNDHGCLGLADGEVVREPTGYHAFQLEHAPRIVAVRQSWQHSLVLSSDGRVFSAGANTHMQLGHGDDLDRYSLTAVDALHGVHVLDIGTGHTFSLALA
eukprot:ANDGO_01747.mRNA.1 Protein pim1